MYLADDYFEQQKIKDKTNVIYANAGTVIFGIKGFKETLMQVINRKNINLRLFHKLVKIDGDKKLAYYEIIHADSDVEHPIEYNHNPKANIQTPAPKQVIIPFDMLHLAPPQSAPDFIKHSPFAHQEGPNKGFMNVHKNTLQHPVYKNVYGLGDAAALPTAKTGAAVRKQAPVIVDRILNAINGKGESTKEYNGYSSCPITTGYGKMLLAEFGYDNVPMPDPLISKFIDTTKESYLMWLLKKYGLPFLYWQMMMKGRM
jgi:sulfide:quinone oxidoreductase